MGRVAPAPENVLAGYKNIPKFGGLKKGEVARILAFEFGEAQPNQPFGSYAEFVHRLAVPAVTEKRADNTVVELVERKWFGNYICLGDEAKLLADHFDPDSCPLCAEAKDDERFKPERRHGTNIVVYSTRAGTFDLQEPWSVRVLAWFFNERVFAQLAELHARWKNLQRHDLLITCDNAQYQNYRIDVAPDAAWLSPEFNPGDQDPTPWKRVGLTTIVSETVKGNKVPDDVIGEEIGQRVGRTTLVEKAAAFKRELSQAPGAAPVETQPPMSAESVSDILAGTSSATAPVAKPSDTPATIPTSTGAQVAEAVQEATEDENGAVPTAPKTEQSIEDLLS